jgi:hypoxanthine phosphoribosyltransferase
MSDIEYLDYRIDKILITEEQIKNRIKELGKQISKDFKGKELTVVSILRGSFLFTADLCRSIDLDQKLDFMAVSSYGNDTKSSGIVKVEKDLAESITGRHVLIIEDIIDTGLTLSHVLKLLKTREPASIKICVLCNKPSNLQQHVNIDYCGFTIGDEFVVGYGLDHKGYLRNLPYIGIVKPEYQ